MDVYPADVVEGLIADGRLDEGEDYDVIISWRFVYGGDCEVDEPQNTIPDEPEVEVPVKLTAPSKPAEIQTAAR